MTLPTDTWAYQNGLNRLPPSQKLGFSLLMLGLALVSQPLTQIALSLWMAVWIIGYAKIPMKFYLKLLLGGYTFVLMSSLAFLIDVQTVESGHLEIPGLLIGWSTGSLYWSISQTVLDLFMRLILRAVACLSCFFFLMLTVPMVEIVQVLRQWRFPELLLELILLMYRLIWVLQKTVSDLRLGQKARGGYGNFAQSLRSISLLIRQLLHRTLTDYHHFSLGATARGFEHKFTVLSMKRYERSPRYEWEALLGFVLLLSLELSGIAHG
ncbi:MAG: cobalt ECF transporter T component CbiQ [Roseofilum sp. SBFL]|uniref:cobalt ECF transporter T component CbiQ n=1 Tax=unclassified Roseofilum TaxID=2620099 RepID=UPI001B06EFFA|nr:MULTISPECIES: cobalt ECF transporter T component CbiQ [unclassified Roseofilum]MBP0014433.1 cobalt ECF transporter T component CbiQ [Roseofilum sp. SID3]MBP0023798.1 cobalt ECF transporter T component CbiQ [Roseofilum sp. SID2]MBP0038685.1 cobalt ECF transporter T component CbiQ [Roseofilum sp. SID1]MBP0042952.1 cobalt ECF transporter T component CbiQ [Roseofilum sp. SBFL]